MTWSLRRAGALTLLLMLSSGCGTPNGGEPRTVSPADVPYRLLDGSSSPNGPAGERDRPAETDSRIYWVAHDGILLPVGRAGRCSGDAITLAESLLAELVDGPTPEERRIGLGTALTPGSALKLEDLSSGTASVEIDPDTQVHSAELLPVAIGQVVLTLTSVPGVATVSITHDREPLQVPLPGGALTAGPVTAADYDELVPRRDRPPQPEAGETPTSQCPRRPSR